MRRDDDTERGDRLGAASVSAAGERSDAGSAVAGARQASLADQTPRDGQKLTRDLIRVSVGERYAQKVTVSTSKHGAVEIVEVQVTTPLPVLGLWGPAEVWELRGRSIVEDIDRD